MDKNATKEFIISNAILLFAILAGFFSGLTLFFIYIASTACFIYIMSRFRWIYSLIPSAIFIGVVSLVMGQFDVIIFATVFLPVLGASIALKMKKGMLHSVTCQTAGWMAAMIILLLMIKMGLLNSLLPDMHLSDMPANISQAFGEAMSAYGLPPEQAAAYYSTLTASLPAAVICIFGAVSYLSQALALVFLRRRDMNAYIMYRPFIFFKADRACAVVSIVCLAIGALTDGIIAKTCYNISVVTGAFIIVCGISVACFFAHSVKSGALRSVIYVIIFVTLPITSYLFMILGYVDTFINIRRIRGKKEE